MERLESLIFDNPDDAELRKHHKDLMGALRRIEVNIAELAAGDYTLPDMGRERGFQP